MHGFRPARRSLYGRQLAEKQKLAFYYNIRNGQLRRYMEAAQKAKQSTPDALQEMLETRLDNVVRRIGWARTIWQARQMVSHGHFQVNGRKVDRPGYGVSAGDTISVKERSQKFVKACAETCEENLLPAWLTVDPSKPEASVIRKPYVEDVRFPFEVDYSLIIEFYTR